MANLFAKLVGARLHDAAVWLDMSMTESYDAGTREWALKNASEEMSKIDDDFRTLKNATHLEVKGFVGSTVAKEYYIMKERLNKYLNK